MASPPTPAGNRRCDQRSGPYDDRGVGQVEYRPDVYIEIIDNGAKAEAIHDVPERSANHQPETPLPKGSGRPCGPIVKERRQHGQGEPDRRRRRETGKETEGNALVVYDREGECVRN